MATQEGIAADLGERCWDHTVLLALAAAAWCCVPACAQLLSAAGVVLPLSLAPVAQLCLAFFIQAQFSSLVLPEAFGAWRAARVAQAAAARLSAALGRPAAGGGSPA